MILAFDTETTGLPDFKAPSDGEQQPHLVQLAMILLDDDLVERSSVSVIIRPDGWVISEEMTAIHGISQELALAVGVPERAAASLYASLLYGTAAKAVAHNVSFDLRIMRIALLRAGYTKDRLDGLKPETFCTMTAASPLLNLPPTDKMKAAGFTKPKPPRLGECYQHFFGEELVGAHDALVDVRACLRVYRHLMAKERALPRDPIGTELGAEDRGEPEETV